MSGSTVFVAQADDPLLETHMAGEDDILPPLRPWPDVAFGLVILIMAVYLAARAARDFKARPAVAILFALASFAGMVGGLMFMFL